MSQTVNKAQNQIRTMISDAIAKAQLSGALCQGESKSYYYI